MKALLELEKLYQTVPMEYPLFAVGILEELDKGNPAFVDGPTPDLKGLLRVPGEEGQAICRLEGGGASTRLAIWSNGRWIGLMDKGNGQEVVELKAE